jgi:uncharacterized Zn finger protein
METETLKNRINAIFDCTKLLSVSHKGLKSISWTIDAPWVEMVALELKSEFNIHDSRMYSKVLHETTGYHITLFVRSNEEFHHEIIMK